MIYGKIWIRKDGTYSINDNMYHVTDETDITKKDVEEYLKEHPEALIPEPEPPKPTQEQIAEAKHRATLSQLEELDRKSMRYLRAIAEGTIDEEGKKRLSLIESEAKNLRASL